MVRGGEGGGTSAYWYKFGGSVVMSTPPLCIASLVPRPSYTAADGLHHRYVKRGSGVLLYKFLSRCPGMLGHQSDSRHAIIAYLSYCLKLFVTARIDDNGVCSASY